MVQLGGNGLVIGNGSTEFSGAINGSGGLRIAGGTQTLSGVNGYTNATQIDQGATLALKGNGSIASSATVTFAPAGAGTASFDISQTNSGASVGAVFDILGVGAISLGSKTLTIANGGTFNGVIQDGGIGGGAGGGLTVAGNELDLGGVNTYTGATTIMAGATLALLSPGSIAASSGVNLAGASASFDISGSGTGQTIKDLSGVAGSTVSLGSFGLTVGTANSTTFAGSDRRRRPLRRRWRLADQGGRGHADADRHQHFHRRSDRGQWRHAGGERQPHQQRHGGSGRHAGRQRHDHRQRDQRTARSRRATRSAR